MAMVAHPFRFKLINFFGALTLYKALGSFLILGGSCLLVAKSGLLHRYNVADSQLKQLPIA